MDCQSILEFIYLLIYELNIYRLFKIVSNKQ